MTQAAQTGTHSAAEIIRNAGVTQSPNGICYASAGETALPTHEMERMVAAVPRAVAAALERKAYYFVPLAVSQGEETIVADRYDVALSDNAVCHRNVNFGSAQCVFISTRLMEDRFSVGFEFYINVAHAFVEQAGVSQAFADLIWKQVQEKARGETSIDAFELRKGATSLTAEAEKAKNDYFSIAFADSIAIYMLSLYIDVDYFDLREREYPLLAPNALAERLRMINEMFPPNAGFEFAVYYKRRT